MEGKQAVNHETIMYFSGSMTQPSIVERLTSTNVHRLFTFAHPKEVHKYLNYCRQHNRTSRLMMDSGAFTAWNVGRPMQLRDLLDYDLGILDQYPQHEFVFISLDVIPGERGRRATQVEIDKAVQQSYDNFLVMKQELGKRGAKVLPVYHSGEDKSLRDAYLRETDYVCLSMNQDLSENQRLAWAQEAIVPGYKFHGLAATGNKMLSTVDWYSVDSSGVLMVAAMGSILMPREGRLQTLAVSHDSPMRKMHGKHLDTLTDSVLVKKRLERMGYDVHALATDYAARVCFNIDRWNERPWVKKPVTYNGLF